MAIQSAYLKHMQRATLDLDVLELRSVVRSAFY